jgi:hypothetical protein
MGRFGLVGRLRPIFVSRLLLTSPGSHDALAIVVWHLHLHFARITRFRCLGSFDVSIRRVLFVALPGAAETVSTDIDLGGFQCLPHAFCD